jgi:regulator of sirC expression with transglutaminase-like and TPR domain
MEPGERFARLLARPPAELPLDEAALCIAAHRRPGLDIAGYLGRLDELATACRTPTLDGLVATLFGRNGFRGNVDDYYDPDNSMLDQVIDRRHGIPITLAVVAMEIGRRIGVPLDGVGMPGHFLLRDKVDRSVFVDPFDGGRVLDAHGCRRIFDRVTAGRIEWSADHLDPMARPAIIERMLTNLKHVYAQSGDVERLRWVVRLRLACPGVDQAAERDELARLMAPLN